MGLGPLSPPFFSTVTTYLFEDIIYPVLVSKDVDTDVDIIACAWARHQHVYIVFSHETEVDAAHLIDFRTNQGDDILD